MANLRHRICACVCACVLTWVRACVRACVCVCVCVCVCACACARVRVLCECLVCGLCIRDDACVLQFPRKNILKRAKTWMFGNDSKSKNKVLCALLLARSSVHRITKIWNLIWSHLSDDKFLCQNVWMESPRTDALANYYYKKKQSRIFLGVPEYIMTNDRPFRWWNSPAGKSTKRRVKKPQICRTLLQTNRRRKADQRLPRLLYNLHIAGRRGSKKVKNRCGYRRLEKNCSSQVQLQ